MSFDSVPYKSEVMGWNAPRLAEFIKRRDLTGCDKVIMKCNMDGQRFLNMSDNDLQRFPKVHAPLISKIRCEINKKEEKKGFFHKRSSAPKYQEPELVQDACWSSEEFDSDDDYESPDADGDDAGSGGDYESPTEGPAGGGAESDNDYEPPPTEPSDELPHPPIHPAKPIGDSEYIDNNRTRSLTKSQPPVPPERPGPAPPAAGMNRLSLAQQHRPRAEQSPQRPCRPPGKTSTAPPAPRVDRSKKPSTMERGFNDASLQAAKVSTAGDWSATPPRRQPVVEKPPDPLRMPKPPLPAPGVRRSVSAVSHGLSVNRYTPDLSNKFCDDGALSKPPIPFGSNTFPMNCKNQGSPLSIPTSTFLSNRLKEVMDNRSSTRRPLQTLRTPDVEPEDEQDMDSAWYVGQVTRGQAEGCLRCVNKDGAFLVRDSSKRSSEQPYTLMVLYQDKVFNIQIRYNDRQNIFLLGTGLKASENFPRVRDIIEQHMQTPLLLIDAKNRGSGQQNQCPLIYPAGN